MKRFKYLALATLVGAWACSSDNPVEVVTGSISGTVSIEGSGASGITVSLSSGASTTTDGSGQYSFTSVAEGAYTVTISDYPTDVTFSATSKAAAINTAGQTVPVDFSGTYIRTSSIVGTVAAGGTGIAGVSVAATGPGGTQNKVTDANGTFAMTGLRAGQYTVEISDIPDGYTFSTTSKTVTVAAGATEQAQFSGTKDKDEVTAQVAIAGIKTPTGTSVNPSNVSGQIDVTLNIDPGTNQLSQVCLLIDGDVVPNACQTLSSAVAGLAEGPEAQAILAPTFTILTDALAEDGTPMWLNGARTLSAQLDLTNATQASVSTSQQLTFNNADAVTIEVSPAVGPEIGGDGLAWNGGDVMLTGVPAMYSGGTVASMTLCAKQNSAAGTPAAGTTACKTASSAPFTVTIPKTSTSGSNLTGWSSSNVTASASTVTTGGSNGPSATTSSFRLDEVAPDFSVALPASVVDNWLGSNFTFKSSGSSATVTGLADVGGAGEVAGGSTVTFHAATADDAGTNTDAHNAAVVDDNAAITNVTGLESTISNLAYVLVVRAVDAVGNETIKRMTAPAGFGVDLVAPTFTVASGSTKDMAINPTAGVSVSLTDDYSGIGPNPLSLQIFKNTVADGTECVETTNTVIGDGDDAVSDPDDGECDFNALGSTTFGFTPFTNDAYYTVTWRAVDKAGNYSDTDSRMVLLDATAPTVDVTGFSISNGQVSATGTVEDNLDLGEWDTRLFFGAGGNFPFGTPTTVSAFGEPLDDEAPANGTATIIKGISIGGTMYAMSGVGFGVSDVARNFASAEFTSAQVPGTITGTVSAFTVNNPDICLSGATSTACTTPTPDVAASVTLKAVATTGDTDDNPFTKGVYFFVESASGVNYLVGQTAAVAFTTGAGTRTWTWSMTLDASQLPLDIVAGGTVNVHAVAVEADFDALMATNTLAVF